MNLKPNTCWLRNFFLVHLVFLSLTFPIMARAQGQGEDAFWKEFFEGSPLPTPAFKLNSPGSAIFLNYLNFGKFVDAGGTDFHYVIKDEKGFEKALGEGIAPNWDIYKDPDYLKLNKNGLLRGSAWDYVHSNDHQRAFFIWAQAAEEPGVKLFFTARVLENAGLLQQAIKAYYAVVALHPKSAAWAADHTFFWYVAPTAMASINRLCRDYPDLNCELDGASFILKEDEYMDLNDRIIKVNPGKIVFRTIKDKLGKNPDLKALKIAESRGQGAVRLVEYSNGHWQMLVDGRPYYIKGVTYSPTEIGLGPENDPDFDARWMFSDKDHDGVIDAPYKSWVESPQKPIGDFQLLKDMGVNTIRIYAQNNPPDQYDPSLINKPLLRDMYKRFGIRAIIGDELGAYTVGSGASWDRGTDYTDPVQRERMKAVVRAKVMDLKDEPFVLMWVLGNENNLPANYTGVNASRTNAASQPKAYAQFLNEVAEMIHKIDPNHPVAVGNLELGLLNYYQEYAPAIDVLGVNSYRGAEGFGSLFTDAKNEYDRPVVMMEYGCDAYMENKGPDEDRQLDYLKGYYRDLVFNKPGGPGVGNALGGLIFEFLDEWWKAPGYPENEHVTRHQQLGQTPDGYVHEEWFGIAGQGDGKNSPLERHLRKAYYYFKDKFNSVPGI